MRLWIERVQQGMIKLINASAPVAVPTAHSRAGKQRTAASSIVKEIPFLRDEEDSKFSALWYSLLPNFMLSGPSSTSSSSSSWIGYLNPLRWVKAFVSLAQSTVSVLPQLLPFVIIVIMIMPFWLMGGLLFASAALSHCSVLFVVFVSQLEELVENGSFVREIRIVVFPARRAWDLGILISLSLPISARDGNRVFLLLGGRSVLLVSVLCDRVWLSAAHI